MKTHLHPYCSDALNAHTKITFDFRLRRLSLRNWDLKLFGTILHGVLLYFFSAVKRWSLGLVAECRVYSDCGGAVICYLTRI